MPTEVHDASIVGGRGPDDHDVVVPAEASRAPHPWRRDRVLWGVLAAAVVVRLLWARVLPMHAMGDTVDYLQLAHHISRFDLSGYNGARTPGYPLLLALLGSNHFWVGLAQGILGVVGTGIAYVIVRRATGNRAAAAVGAILATLSMVQLINERSVLTEFFASFLLLVLVLLLQRPPAAGAPWSAWYRWSAAVGFVMAYAALTRPSLVAVVPAVAVFVWTLRRRFPPRRRSAALAVAALALLPTVAAYLGWVSFNARQNHWATISTNQGQGLTNVTCQMDVRADNRPDGIIDLVYLPFRNAYRQGGNNCAGAVTPAFARLRQVTGWSQVETEKRLSQRALHLIERRPGLYAGQTWRHLSREWRGSVPRDPRVFRGPLRGTTYEVVRDIQVVIARAARYGFLVMAVVGLLLALIRRRWPDPFFTVVVAMVLCTSVANVLFESDRLPELLDPFQPVIVLMLVAGTARVVVRQVSARADGRAVGSAAAPSPVA